MLLSEIGNKEIVDLSTGCSHGELWNAELLFEKKSGKIKAVLVPSIQSTGLFHKEPGEMCQLPRIFKPDPFAVIFPNRSENVSLYSCI